MGANAISSLYVIFSADTKKFSAAMSEISRSVREVEKVIKPVKDRVQDLGRAMTVGFTVPVVAGFAAVTKAGVEFESAFAGVRKTVTASEPEFAKLREEIRKLSEEVPITASELAGIAAIGGQFNVPTELLGKFTKTMANLSITTGMTGKEIAETMAQFTNITGLPKEQIDRLGSSLTELGNNVGSSENKVLDFGLRIAAAGAQIRLTDAQILGFGGALASLGIEAEAGGTAISKTFIKVADAVGKGGAKLEQFAAVAGMSADAFKKQFGEDSAEAIVKFIEGLERMRKEHQNVFGVLEELGMKEVRLERALLSTAKAGDKLRDSIRMSTDEFQRNQATTKEVNERLKTTAAQYEMLKNQLTNIGIELFDAFGPILRDTVIPNLRSLAQLAGESAKSFQKWPEELKAATLAFVGLTAVVGPGLLILVKISSTLIGLGAAAAKAGFGIAGISALISALPLLAAVKNVGDFSAAVSLIGGTSIAATAGLVALAAAVGVAIGMFANWLIKSLGLEESLDRLLKKGLEYIPFIGKWATGQSVVDDATAGTIAAQEALAAQLTKTGVAFDRSRLGDQKYIGQLLQQQAAMNKLSNAAAFAETSTKKIGQATAGAGADFETLNEALKEQEAAAKNSENAIKALVSGVTREKDETSNLVKAIAQLERQHVSAVDIRNRLGKQISENVNSLREEDRTVPAVLVRYAALYKQHQVSIEATEELRVTTDNLDASFRKLQRTPALVASQFERFTAANMGAAEIIELLGPSIQEAVNVIDKIPGSANEATRAIIQQAEGMRRSVAASQTFSRVTKEVRDDIEKFQQEPQLLAERFRAMQAANLSAAATMELLGPSVQKVAQLLREVPEAADATTTAVIAQAEAMRRSVQTVQQFGKAVVDIQDDLTRFRNEPGLIAIQFLALRRAGASAQETISLLGPAIQKTAESLREMPDSANATTRAIIEQADAMRRAVQTSQTFARTISETRDSLAKFRNEPALVAVQFVALRQAGASAEEAVAMLGSSIQKAAETIQEIPGSANAATAALIMQADAVRRAVLVNQAFVRVNMEARDSLEKLRIEPQLVAAQFLALQRAGASAQEIVSLLGPAILKTADSLQEVPGSADAATAAIVANAAALVRGAQSFRDIAAASTQAQAELKKFREDPTLVAAQFIAMQTAGASAEEIFVLMGSAIQKTAETLRLVPGAANPSVTAIIRQADEMRRAVGITASYTASVVSATDALEALRRAPQETVNKIRELQRSGATATEIIMVMGNEITNAAQAAKELKVPLDEASKATLRLAVSAKTTADMAKQFREAWTAAMANVVTDFSNGVTEMIFSGQKFSDVLKGIFKDLAKSLVKILVTDTFTTIAQGFSKIITGKGGGGGGGSLLGGLLSGLGGKLAGVFGIGGGGAAGAAGGAAAGGGAMGSLGAFFTNPITAIAGGALGVGLLIKHFVGGGRKAADEFVKNIQTPFDNAYSRIVDNFGAMQSSGTLTLDAARQSRLALSALISDYKSAANTFGSQGKNQAKVSVQSTSGRLQGFADQLNGMDTVINQLAATTKAAGAGGAGLPGTGLASSASNVFAAAVDRLVPALETLVGTLQTGGGGIGGQGVNVTLTVPEITVPLQILQTLDASAVRDIIIPEITKVLKLGVRGVTEDWATIIKNAFESLVAQTATK